MAMMGLVHASITLKNPRHPELRPLEIRALADTGALHLCIPEHVAIQLRLEQLQEREVVTADGSTRVCPYVGPIEVRFGDRACFAGALVLGDEVLLGAVPMEDMDLVISPSMRTVTVNPSSPNIPSSTAKQLRYPDIVGRRKILRPELRIQPQGLEIFAVQR
jgi:clan AA aspartic protease